MKTRNHCLIASKLESETWATVVFRVRETDDVSGVLTYWANAGVLVQLSSNTNGSSTVSATAFNAVDDGDGFFILTADISGFSADDIRYIRYIRFDPIGGSSTTDNNAAGNTFEVDFIQLNAIPEPSTMLLGSIGILGLLRRRR